MAFLMASLRRSPSGSYIGRKGIPQDVRSEYQRLYGAAWEVQFHAPAGTPISKAKAAFSEWLADVEARIAGIRAAANGEGQPLSAREAHALAGEWYRWFVARHEGEPGQARQWWWQQVNFVDEIFEFAPPSIRDEPQRDPEWDWSKSPDMRTKIRPIVADAALTAQFLASKNVVLSNEARDRFLDCVQDEFIEAVRLLERRAEGDFSVDPRPQRFPTFTAAGRTPTDGSSCRELFERWIKAKEPASATVARWRAVFEDLNTHFDGRTAASITEDDANAWKNGLIKAERTAATVADVWVRAARTIFAWAVKQKLIRSNPFADVSVTVPKRKKLRADTFTTEEANTILSASLRVKDTTRPFAGAQRWVPWICAYTGARSGEIAQLRGRDVVVQEGHHAIVLTPEAGTIKTGEARTVPLHEHLIAQGFLDYVKTKGTGALFYNEEDIPAPSTDITRPKLTRAENARQRLAGWVRSIGITDKNVKPNHAWRGTFKQLADRCGISERVSDEITGHAPQTVGRTYGRPSLGDMAKALEKFPRYT